MCRSPTFSWVRCRAAWVFTTMPLRSILRCRRRVRTSEGRLQQATCAVAATRARSGALLEAWGHMMIRVSFDPVWRIEA